MTKDKIGIALSVGCLIHCILMPLILPLLPLFGLVTRHGFLFHIVMAAIIGVVAYFAFRNGYKKHKVMFPPTIGFMGVLSLFVGGLAELIHVDSIALVTTICGSILLVTAHYFNHKLSCSCKHHV
jgi:hypothetical protein